jgi:hypothetical protein
MYLNKIMTNCTQCKQSNIKHMMFYFNDLLYCFKCSMIKLKNKY